MPGRRLPERAAFVAAVLGVAMGLLFLFAPIPGSCRVTATSTVPGQIATLGPTICTRESLVALQRIWPLPFLAVAVWSVAPLISYVGVRRKMAGQSSGTALIILALVLEATVLISFGAAPFFAPFVLLPLVISTALALSARVVQRSA
ncbi:MAG TPA: hypothetical protein VJ726_12315 [Candidatus Limnocylindria bacterium]|nr:hypothetical protein [Candidatus Limnocylindria bacterium]